MAPTGSDINDEVRFHRAQDGPSFQGRQASWGGKGINDEDHRNGAAFFKERAIELKFRPIRAHGVGIEADKVEQIIRDRSFQQRDPAFRQDDNLSEFFKTLRIVR
ncbi:hypothetical protein [Breoghania corrubedonensis]|uniref:hypothetical protein n=1 Tax=Breoghania corrubedonensis TaxID=665038 RepID=UPI001FE9A8C9|nr:hypothetical protein [Breoghania corrubedonensis]